jgi:hypothetical protein
MLLGDEHLDELPPTREERAQRPGVRIGERPQGGPHPLGEEGKHRRIDRIGLGEATERLGEVTDA